MTTPWTEAGLLWMNPPFSMFAAVVSKIVTDRAQCILIMPDWPNRKYWPQVQLLKRAEVFFQPGTQLFELDGNPHRATRWGTWPYWL